MIKTPLRYPGGKSRAIKYIIPLIPEFKEYREPFLGGGSVYIYLKQKFQDKKFWINDIYENLYLFWSQLQECSEGLIEQVQYYKNNYQDGRELHKFLLDNIKSFDKLQKAAAFFVLNRITFSGTSESGGFSSSAFKNRFTQTSINRIKSLSRILTNTKITNLDYQHIVEAEGEDVFIFLDPPYYSSTKSALYGKNGNLHKYFDHKKFAEIMKNVRHKWLITYDNSEYIKDLFSFANIKEWNLKYGMRNVGKSGGKSGNQNGSEIFISNYSFPNSNQIADYNLFRDYYLYDNKYASQTF
ncbi:MAG TPA: DNA adenine methylase [Candidatus Kapabacteria bacterium]|nr:DNA adenine methylase [Candidatus Kapabacteria bacterium]HOM04747.1 DNA adenine methylase [Candidatus Kapabacteria bacterium]HPP38933.1 DNA adenine methylase [Candidatus Kapabacteria bacterium]